MKKIIYSTLAVFIFLVITSCDSGGGGGDGGSGSGSGDGGSGSSLPAAPIGDISGTWKVSEVSTSPTAGCSNIYNYNITVSQNGNKATVTDAGGNVFRGTLSGNKLTWSGSYPEAPGTTTANVTATIGANCSSFKATSTWSYSETGFSCNGTSEVSGLRVNSTGCGNISSTADTESEPNDAINVADTLTAGVPMQGTTSITSSTIEDDDYYVFTVPTTAKYRFDISYASALLTIVLYNSNLVFLYDSNVYIQSAVSLTAGTVFYIQIDPATASGTVPYTLTVNAI